MKASTARFILTRVMGWTPVENFPQEPKMLFLGVPHTSVWDMVVAYLYATSQGAPIHLLIKD